MTEHTFTINGVTWKAIVKTALTAQEVSDARNQTAKIEIAAIEKTVSASVTHRYASLNADIIWNAGNVGIPFTGVTKITGESDLPHTPYIRNYDLDEARFLELANLVNGPATRTELHSKNIANGILDFLEGEGNSSRGYEIWCFHPVNLTAQQPLIFSIAGVAPSQGNSDGSIAVTVTDDDGNPEYKLVTVDSGGTETIIHDWQASGNFASLPADDYRVYVKDDNELPVYKAITLVEPV